MPAPHPRGWPVGILEQLQRRLRARRRPRDRAERDDSFADCDREVAVAASDVDCVRASDCQPLVRDQLRDFRAGVRSYHVLNLLIHLGCALTLFGVVRRTLQSSSLRAIFGADATYVAAAVALIWVAHPLTTAAVTYIVQRVESLMSLFYLLTLYCAIRAAESARRGLWTVASIASCALGVATKEVMITAPVAVALWDVVFLRGRTGSVGAARRAGSDVAGVRRARLGEQREASIAMSGTMAWRYLLTQAQVLTQYLRLAFVPAPLVFLYTWPLVTTPADVIVEGLLIAAYCCLRLSASGNGIRSAMWVRCSS